MATFAGLWWLWLVLAFVFLGYALFNQVSRMNRMMGGRPMFSNAKAEDPIDGFKKGLLGFALSGLLGSLSFVLFLVAVVWLLVKG